jgi:hypothetical protein
MILYFVGDTQKGKIEPILAVAVPLFARTFIWLHVSVEFLSAITLICNYIFLYCDNFLDIFICADYLTGKKLQLPSIGDGLTERGTMQPVSLERDTVLHAQVCNSESNNFLSPIHLSVFHLFQHGQIVHAYLEICKKRAWVTLYAMTLYSGLPVYLFSMKNGFSGKLFTKLLPVPVLNVLRYSSRMRLVPVSVILLLKKKSYSSNFLLNHARDLFKKESFIFGFSSFTISK